MKISNSFQNYFASNIGLLTIGIFFFIPSLYYFLPEEYHIILFFPLVTIYLYSNRYSGKVNKSWFDLAKFCLVIVSTISYSILAVIIELIHKHRDIFYSHEAYGIIYFILYYISFSSLIALGVVLVYSFGSKLLNGPLEIFNE